MNRPLRDAVRAHPEGATVCLRVVPRAGRTEFAGYHDDAVRVRLAAPPVDGAANDALVRFVAETCGVARSAVEVISGDRGRSKVVLVRGVTPAGLMKALLVDPALRRDEGR